MDFFCENSGCKLKAVGKCFCGQTSSFYCSDHMRVHLQSVGPHSYEEIVNSDLPEKSEIIKVGYSLMRKLHKSRSRVLEESQRLQQEIECQTDSILKKIRELELICDNIVKSAAGILEKEYSSNMYIQYILSQNMVHLKDEINSWQHPIVEVNTIVLNKLYAMGKLTPPFTHFPLSIEQSASISLNELHHSTSNEICYFKQNSKCLVTINVETGEKVEKDLNIPENMPYGAGIIELPGGNILHVGGTLGNPIGSCYLMKNDKIEKLSSFRPRAAPAIAHLDGKVYAIGGRDGKYIKDIEVFSLLTKEWKSLPPIPETTNGICAVNFGPSLLYAGYYHKKLFSFDTCTYAYSELIEIPEGNKVLTVGNGQAYIICNRKLIESSFSNTKEWKVVKDVPFAGGWCLNHPIRVNNYIYFLVDYCQKELWRFDLNTKDLMLTFRF